MKALFNIGDCVLVVGASKIYIGVISQIIVTFYRKTSLYGCEKHIVNVKEYIEVKGVDLNTELKYVVEKMINLKTLEPPKRKTKGKFAEKDLIIINESYIRRLSEKMHLNLLKTRCLRDNDMI